MTIEIIQGTPGSGKSATALCIGIGHLCAGGALATNFSLVPDWAYMLAGLKLGVRLGLRNRLALANAYYDRCFRVGSADSIFELSEKLKTCPLGDKFKSRREGRGLLILDEAQLVFNSRSWGDNRKWIEFFTQHRKFGWDVILVAHHIQMIDKQIRPLIDLETRFRNLKKVRWPIIGLPLSPLNLFLGVRFYAGYGPGSGLVYGRFVELLDKSISSLYDTMHVFAFDDVHNSVDYQGNRPIISKEIISDYSPDFFLGPSFALFLRKHFLSSPPSTPKRYNPPYSSIKPSPGSSRTHYY